MTGFGSAEGEVGRARVAVEVRSVNHRFFNPSIKLPASLGKWEGDVREVLRRGVARGHVTLFVRLDRAAAEGPRINEQRFGEYVATLRGLQARFGLSETLDADTVLRLPEVLTTEAEEDDGTVAQLLAIVERAVTALDAMRSAEGARLYDYLVARIAVIERAVERIAERAPARLLEQRDRMRQTIGELAGGVAIDEQRLAQEIAVLADRLDVGEEIARFHAHLAAFRATLDSTSPEGVGKRLGFLLQELLREANTTGSKANDAAMVEQVIVIKEELERIREQVENLE